MQPGAYERVGMSPGRRMAFRVAAGILILGAVVHVATLWPRVTALAAVLPTGSWLVVLGFGFSAFTALLACGLALLLLWKAADSPAGRILTLFLAFLAFFWGSLFRFLDVSAESNSVHISLSYGGNWISLSAVTAAGLAAAAFMRFSALFPQPLTAERLPSPRRFGALRRLRLATLRPLPAWGSVVLTIVLMRVLPDVMARAMGVEAGGPESQTPAAVLIAAIVPTIAFVLYCLAALLVGTRNLRASYRIASSEERSRILWVVTGFSIASWLILGALGIVALIAFTDLSVAGLGAAIPIAIVLAPLVVVVCAAMGVLYSGAIDSTLVLQRSTVYGALGAVGFVTFAGIENALSSLIEGRLGLPSFAGAMVAGGLVAAVLVPLRGFLRRRVKRVEGPGAETVRAEETIGTSA